MKLTQLEKQKYLLKTKRDYEILQKIKQAERLNLTKEEKETIKLIRTQLEQNWRKYLIIKLDKILKKRKTG